MTTRLQKRILSAAAIATLAGGAVLLAADDNAAPATSRPAANDQTSAPSLLGGPRLNPQNRPAWREGAGRPGPRGRLGPMARPFADRPGFRGNAGGFEGGPGEPLTPEKVDRILLFMKRNFPVMHERLTMMRERNPEMFRRAMMRAAQSLGPMLRAALEDPELEKALVAEHKALMEMGELREKYHKTQDAAERQRLQDEIRGKMEIGYEARLARLRHLVSRLQEQLNRAQQDLTRQEERKSQFIDENLSRVLSQPPSSAPGDDR